MKRDVGNLWSYRLEIYHQRLFDIPIIEGTSFSFLNLHNDWFVKEAFSNSGRGRNYGIEATAERFLDNGWYGLATASIYRSQHDNGKGWLDTRYDKRFLFNLLFGKNGSLVKHNRMFSISI
jgi:hypothetical protein